MYGTLRGALAGRKIQFDRDSFKAAVDGRISGIGKTIRIKSIHVHYDLTVPPDALQATERALRLHPEGCPAHQSVKDAIEITWDAAVHAGGQTIKLREELTDPAASRTSSAE
ncbi:MAG TPA: OsmC family protein [Terriglobia bacterium]|nr:OsmC family protein [Terriglobia bacterium]